MKFKYLKAITLISIIFSVYSAADEISKPAYVHIAFEFTGGGSYLIHLMETNKKECSSTMKQLFKEYSAACIGCKPIKQECISVLPSEYNGVFEKKKIKYPYVYIPGEQNEVAIHKNFSNNLAKMFCNILKNQDKNTICVN